MIGTVLGDQAWSRWRSERGGGRFSGEPNLRKNKKHKQNVKDKAEKPAGSPGTSSSSAAHQLNKVTYWLAWCFGLRA